jgi:hypothetical protein
MSQPDKTLTDDEISWISECAGRLRLIQCDAAGLAPDERRECLHEEIERSFKGVPKANSRRLLEALLARFPVAGLIAGSTPAPATPAPPEPVAETPDQLVDRFFAAAAKLPAEKRAEISRRLIEAGLANADRAAAALEVSEASRKKLGLGADQHPRPERMVELAVFLVEALSLLDQTALKTMRELSSRSPLLKRSEELRKTAARFLTNENESLDAQWQAIRGLMGGLLAAMQGGGKDFGRQFVERLSPSAIEDVIVGEGSTARFGLMGPSKKERCWDKYKDLAGDYATPDLVERRIKDCLAAFVERAILGNR